MFDGPSKKELAASVADFEAERERLAAFIPAAQSMADEYDQASRTGALPDEAYDIAVARVRDRHFEAERTRLATEVEQRVESEVVTSLRQEIRDAEGPAIEAEAKAKVAEKEPEIKEKIRAQLLDEETRRLAQESPTKIEAEIRETEGPAIAAEAERSFEAGEGIALRKQIKARVQQEVGRLTVAQLRAKIEEDEKATVLVNAVQQQREKDEYATRVGRLTKEGRESYHISLSDLRAGDILTVVLCSEQQTFSTTAVTEERAIRLSIRDIEEGLAMLIDDTWQRGKPLEQAASIKSGVILRIGTHHEHDEEPTTDHGAIITRGVPLSMRTNSHDRTVPGYEVHRVFLGGDEKTQIMGPAGGQSQYR